MHVSFGVDGRARCLPLPSLPGQYLRHAGILDADGSMLDAPQTKQCHHVHRLLGGMATCHSVNHLPPPTSAGSDTPSLPHFTALAWAVSFTSAR